MATARERRIAGILAANIRAVMGRKNVNALTLSGMAGIANSTLGNLLNATTAMDVDQLYRICRALDVDPGPFYQAAIEEADDVHPQADPRIPTGLPLSVVDPRSLVQFLIDNPNADDELAARLGDVSQIPGVSGNKLKRLQDQVRNTRHAELVNALAALPSKNRAAGTA